jgi:hypothetical protein
MGTKRTSIMTAATSGFEGKPEMASTGFDFRV